MYKNIPSNSKKLSMRIRSMYAVCYLLFNCVKFPLVLPIESKFRHYPLIRKAIVIDIHLIKRNGQLGKILVVEFSRVLSNGSTLPGLSTGFHLTKKMSPLIAADDEVLIKKKNTTMTIDA